MICLATISSYNNLAALYRDMGKYVEASNLFEKAIMQLERLSMMQRMEYAIVLNNQSTLQLMLGQPSLALKTSDQALLLAAEHTGKKSKDYLSFMLNSAIIHQSLGHYPKAKEILLSIKEVKEKRFGKKSSQYARTLNNLAGINMEMGKMQEVEPLLKTALSIYLKYFGRNHPTTAFIMGNLGRYYQVTGQNEKAYKQLLEAKDLQAYLLGKYHPEYLKTLEAFAVLNWKTGKIEESKKTFDGLTTGLLDQVQNYFPVMSEEDKTKFWDQSRKFLMVYYSFVLKNHERYPDLVLNMMNVHLATKGLLLSESLKVKTAILNSDDQSLKDKYQLWIGMKESLAKYNAMSKKDVIQMGGNLYRLGINVEKLEKELVEASTLFSKGYGAKVSVLDIKDKLADGEVIVDIVRVDEVVDKNTSSISYVALILNTEQAPKIVILPNGKRLENQNFKYYKNMIRLKLEDSISYGAYWKPIEKEISTASKLYLSQDGIYNQINVNTLLKPDGHYVLEQQQISFITSTRQLSQTVIANTTQDVVLLGDPLFNTPKYTQLPGTKKEVEEINALLIKNNFRPKMIQGSEATEAALKNLVRNPKILHISTHGYFLEDVTSKNSGGFGERLLSVKIHPLLRSGLVLAEPKQSPGEFSATSTTDEEDGLLTAYEAMNFILDDTELVVLSACETGLGDVKAGEGVYGLQRAFQVAGADAIMNSLWKVSDDATQLLMSTFYEKWLKSGDKEASFLLAQKTVKTEYHHPYYWGAFVMMN